MLSVSLLDCTDVDFMVEWLCTKLLVVCHLFLFFCLYCVYDFILYIYKEPRDNDNVDHNNDNSACTSVRKLMSLLGMEDCSGLRGS